MKEMSSQIYPLPVGEAQLKIILALIDMLKQWNFRTKEEAIEILRECFKLAGIKWAFFYDADLAENLKEALK